MGVNPRAAQNLTSGDESSVSLSSTGTAARLRGRNNAHVARHRTSASGEVVHFTMGAISSRAVNRPIERSASPTTAEVTELPPGAVRYAASAARASGVRIFPSARAASNFTGDAVVVVEST